MSLSTLLRWFNAPALTRTANRHDLAKLEKILIGLASVGAVAAYAFQYLQKFTDPNQVFGGASLIAVGLAHALVMQFRARARWTIWVPLLPIALGAGILVDAGIDASNDARWHDRRCARLQLAMLQPSANTRPDIPEIFAAIQCRPQGGPPIDPDYRFHPRGGPPPTVQEEKAHADFLDKALTDEVNINVIGIGNGIAHRERK